MSEATTRRVDFYVLPGGDGRARLRFACQVAEKAYLAGERVLVCFDDPAVQQTFDELLWTFSDRSFVPHEPYDEAHRWQQAPVLLGRDVAATGPFDLLLNLGAAVPAAAAHAARVIEIVDADEERRRLGRMRYRHYRDQGLNPETHTPAGEEPP